MAVTEQLARLIAETTYKQLPVDVITQAKRALLDTTGVTLAGHGEAAGQIITSLVKDAGGHQEAAILVHPCTRRVPSRPWRMARSGMRWTLTT